MLNATPKRVARSRIETAVGTATLNTLLPTNGLRVAGTTDTGRRYRNETVRVTLGTDAAATLDGEDLEGLAPPDRPIVTFGDLFHECPVK